MIALIIGILVSFIVTIVGTPLLIRLVHRLHYGQYIRQDGPQSHQVKRGTRPLTLTPLEFDLLLALAKRPNHVFSREALLDEVWGYRNAADTRLVNVHVQRLRAKVERDPEKPEIVITVRGIGYRAGERVS